MSKQISVNSLILIVGIAIFGFQVFDRFYPRPNPIPAPATYDQVCVDLGKKYAPVIAGTYADAWDAAAVSVQNGGKMQDILEKIGKDWLASRQPVFEAKVSPEFAKTLPQGQEPSTPEQRAAIAYKFRSFAAGLRQDAKAARRMIKTVTEEYGG